MAHTDELAIILSVIFGVFFLVALGVVVWFVTKHYRQSFALHSRFLQLSDADDEQAVQMLQRDADDELSSRQSMYLIPQVVHLLRSCKALTTQLSRAVVDAATAEGTRVVTGSLSPILEAARPVGRRADVLTHEMYPPMDETRMLHAATALMGSIDTLVRVTQENCDTSDMAWLHPATVAVIRDFRAVCIAVERFRVMTGQLEAERAF